MRRGSPTLEELRKMHSMALKEAKDVMSKRPPSSMPPMSPSSNDAKTQDLPPGINDHEPEIPFRFEASSVPVSSSGWIMSVEHEDGSHKPILKDKYRKSIFERPKIPVEEKEGYLLKMKAHSRFGHNVYSKYYFITKGHYLEYYNDSDDAKEDKFPIGVYDLSQVSSVTLDTHESRKAHLKTHFIITFQNGEKKNLKSAFKSEDDVRSWVNALRERVTFYHASKLDEGSKSDLLADNVRFSQYSRDHTTQLVSLLFSKSKEIMCSDSSNVISASRNNHPRTNR